MLTCCILLHSPLFPPQQSLIDDVQESHLKGNATIADLFDAHPLTNVGKDTYVTVTGLHLVQGQEYHITVIASDKAAGCSMSHATFTPDVTPPKEGELYIAEGITNLVNTEVCRFIPSHEQ